MSLTRVQFTIGTVLISFFLKGQKLAEKILVKSQKSTSKFKLDPLTLRLSHNNESYLNDKRGEGEEEHDTVEGDAHTIISCIIFSMSCVLFLIVIVFVYDVVKYTKFGRNYLTVSWPF